MWPFKKERRHSLALTIASTFLVKTIAILLAFSLITTYYQFILQQDNIDGKQQIVAQDAANNVKNFIENIFEIMRSGSSFGNLAESTLLEKETTLQKMLGSDQSFQQIILISGNGSEIVKASRVSLSLVHAITENDKNEILSGINQTDNYVSPVFIDAMTSEPHVIISIPVRDVFGDYKNVLLAEINLKFMWEFIGDIRVGQTGFAFVVDNQGKLIAFSDISRVLSGENVAYLDKVKDFVQNNNMIYSERVTGIKGEDAISTHVPLGVPDWAVIVELPTKEAYAPVIQQMILTGWIILFGCIITIVLSYYLSRQITKPIVALRDAADDIGGGKMKGKIEVDRGDEIGDLAKSFNEMSSKLKKSKENLESIVEKRTRQLDRKMKESEKSRIATLNILEDVEETRVKLSRTYKELKKLDKLKAEFMNMAAHELKTPLIPIIGYLDMIIRGEMGKINKKEKDCLLISFRSAQRLQKLVGDILDISKLETGSMKFYFDDVDIGSIVKNLIESMIPFAKEKKIALVDNVKANLPHVYGDISRMTEIFENLLSNSTKFTEKGGVFVESKVDGNNIIISVRDTGIGMSKEFMKKKLFGKFQQEDTTDRRKYGGTGLGMAISKEIVEKHGGKIWAESEIGKGSTFYVSLPIKK
jgi:signal transduction histidine kinase